MKDAVIVSTARTPIGRAYKGAFNDTKSPTMLGHALAHAVARAGVLHREAHTWPTLCGVFHNIALSSTFLARDQTNILRQERQRNFSIGIKEPFRSEHLFEHFNAR